LVICDQVFCLGDVVTLSASQFEAQWIA
jgi:hypothetical protein